MIIEQIRTLFAGKKWEGSNKHLEEQVFERANKTLTMTASESTGQGSSSLGLPHSFLFLTVSGTFSNFLDCRREKRFHLLANFEIRDRNPGAIEVGTDRL